MITLLILSLLSGSGGWVDDRGCGFFGGTLTADTCLEDDIELKWGDCSDGKYWAWYDLSGTEMEFVSTDIDGAGTDGVIWYVDDGTQILVIVGGLQPSVAGAADLGSAAAYFGDVYATELSCMDTDNSNQLSVDWNENDSADRALHLLVNGGDRSLSLSGDLTVEAASTVNQDVTTDADSQFGSVTVDNTGLHVLDTNASHDLIIAPGSDLTADHTLTVTTGDADRGVSLSGDLTVEASSLINQDLTTDATGVQFADAELTTGPLTVTSDTNGICLGAVGTACTDGKQYFDATDVRMQNPTGAYRFDSPIIGGVWQVDADSGIVRLINQNMTGALADGDPGGVCIAMDNSTSAEFCVTALSDGLDGVDTFDLTVPSYNVDYVVAANGAVLGPTSPDMAQVNGSCAGLGFNNSNETVIISFEVPSCWAGGTADDIILKVYWCPTSTDVPQSGEEVDWEATYRVLDWGTDSTTTGSAVTINGEFTAGGSESDTKTYETTLTLDADDANQPLVKGEVISITFSRDAANEGTSYSSNAIVQLWELGVPQTSLLCDHKN